MKKYRNKNMRISIPEIIGIIVFFSLLMISGFFNKSYNNINELFNIRDTNVDFIIQAPSADQVSEIRDLDHIDSIVPYYYRSVSVSGRNGNVSTTLFIVSDEGEMDNTVFSQKLLVKKTDPAEGNKLYITDDFAKTSQVSVGDTLSIPIDGTDVMFIVAGIFKSDHRRVGGSLLTFDKGDVASALSDKRFSGAFVASNNVAESDGYFKNDYYPMGDLRSRDEFDTEEAYQAYLDTRDQSDTTKDAFSTSEYIKELSNRNEAKQIRYLVVSIVCFVFAFLIILAILMVRTGKYTNNNVLRDIKDNFTIDQESDMYKRYFTKTGVAMVITNVVVYVCAFILRWVNAVSLFGIIGICTSVVLVSACGIFSTEKLKARFLIENKKYEEERKRQNPESNHFMA